MNGTRVNLTDIRPGDQLPTFQKTFTTVDLFAYGAATWDWARAHYDTEFARSLKFAGPFVDGQHFGALFAKRAMDWLGPTSFVSQMKFGFRHMVFVGETIAGSGQVLAIARESDALVVEIEQQFTKGDLLVSNCTMKVRART